MTVALAPSVADRTPAVVGVDLAGPTQPLFGGLPGAPELLVILLLLIVVLAVPVVVFLFVFRTVSDRPSYEERIADLERAVEELRAEVDGDEGADRESLSDVEFPESGDAGDEE